MNPLASLNLANLGIRPEMLARPDTAAGLKSLPASELKQLERPGSLNAEPVNGSFSNVLGDIVHEVNQKQVAANESVKGLITGQNVSLHQAMIAMEEASVSFQLMVEVRNKLLESYQELMRMQM